mgnify:CR=1 FL=1
MKKASLFGLFFLLMYPVTAHASSNCGGDTCTLPPVFPGVPQPKQPVITKINNIIINGMFNKNATDPTWADDSFIYYLEHLDKKTQISFAATGNINTNKDCTNCDSVSISNSRQVGWTNSATLGISTGLDLGRPGATSNFGNSLSQTFGYSQAVERMKTKDFTLNCCSRTRFLDEIYTETDRFLIGWQKDRIGWWEDMKKQVYSVTKTDFGLTEITLDGTCIPEPTSILSFLAVGTFGTFSTLKRKLKSSNHADKELEKVS